MEENKERNRKIYEERLSGKTIADLSCEYGVCEQRIKHIYDQEQRKEDKKDDRLYQLLFALSDNDQLSTKACTVLRRAGADSEAEIVKLDRKQLKKLRGCGSKMEDLIMRVIEEIRKDGMDEQGTEC